MRNTCLYGLGHTKTTRRNSCGIKVDFGNGIILGTNLQNIEKMMRRIYVPDDGYIFIQRDQSGAEAKVVAYLCRKGKFRELFDNNVKPHVYVALHKFDYVWADELNKYAGDIKLNIEEFTNSEIPDLQKHPQWKTLDKLIKKSDSWPPARRYYYMAKQMCHSFNYDAGAGAFILNTLIKSRGKIVISKKDAEQYLLFYHSMFPEIREWHKEVRDIITSTGILYDLYGHPSHFFVNDDMSAPKVFKDAYAQVPQKTIATITANAIVKTYEYIKEHKLDWHILADTHDSFMCQCPIPEEDHCNTIMKKHLNATLKSLRGEEFTMESEGAAGFNWAPFDKDKNPNGLKNTII